MQLLTGIEFVAFGIVVGAYGTMIGVGGGFLIVPFLLLVHQTSPEKAVGTSIVVVFLNAVSGALSYARQRRIDYKAGALFAAATIPGAIAGAFFSEWLSGPAFNVAFALLLIALSLFMLFRAAPASDHAAPDRRAYDLRLGMLVSVGVGFLSSLFGIGGGVIHVPALIHLLSFPTHIATATSTFILAFTAAAGGISHLSLGHVLWGPALTLGIGVIIGAQIGATLGSGMRGRALVKLLSAALILVALRLLLR
jgi:uncharacterized protein